MMPRRARQFAESGIYHVVQRGNGRSLIFEDETDRSFFLSLLDKKRSGASVSLLGWCLMGNHLHLLIFDPGQGLSDYLHGVFTAYAGYFNSKTGHVGAVFQDRFSSVAIESNEQLLAALRYIHENPEKAGIALAREYRWSSYGAYASGSSVVDGKMVWDLLDGPRGFVEWSALTQCGDYAFCEGKRISPEDELSVARYILDGADPSELKSWDFGTRNMALRSLRQRGFTIRQIERLTGIGRSTISRNTSPSPSPD